MELMQEEAATLCTWKRWMLRIYVGLPCQAAIMARQEHQGGYDFDDFRNSVENGKHPDGDEVKKDMPRWQMNDADLKDLMNYLKTLD
jgi:hypothetical protein